MQYTKKVTNAFFFCCCILCDQGLIEEKKMEQLLEFTSRRITHNQISELMQRLKFGKLLTKAVRTINYRTVN